MVEEYTIALAKVIKELGLSEVYLPRSADEILIKSRDVNRPGVESVSYTHLDVYKRQHMPSFCWKGICGRRSAGDIL